MRGSRRDTWTDCCRVWRLLEKLFQVGNSMGEPMRRVQTPAPRQTVAGTQKSGDLGSGAEKDVLFSHLSEGGGGEVS